MGLFVLTPLFCSISHFRCAQANVVLTCDAFGMNDSYVPNTRMNSQSGGFLMSDPNWMDQQSFQPNVACAFYLPPVPGCCWQLYLVKQLDPIVNKDPCQCDCEDNVIIQEDGGQSQTVCNLVPQGGAVTEGWCGHSLGPHNVQGLQPFFSSKNSSIIHINFRQAVCQFFTSLVRVYLQSHQV